MSSREAKVWHFWSSASGGPWWACERGLGRSVIRFGAWKSHTQESCVLIINARTKQVTGRPSTRDLHRPVPAEGEDLLRSRKRITIVLVGRPTCYEQSSCWQCPQRRHWARQHVGSLPGVHSAIMVCYRFQQLIWKGLPLLASTPAYRNLMKFLNV